MVKNKLDKREIDLLIIIVESEINSFGNPACLLAIEYKNILEKLEAMR